MLEWSGVAEHVGGSPPQLELNVDESSTVKVVG